MELNGIKFDFGLDAREVGRPTLMDVIVLAGVRLLPSAVFWTPSSWLVVRALTFSGRGPR